MTQNDLEREMGASGGVVSRWSRGIASPAPKFIERLAELWSVDVDWLLTLTGYRPNVEMRDDLSSPRANLIQLMDEIELTPERIMLVTAMLENMRLVDTSPSMRESRELVTSGR
jgi:transcriptional regulator with XRE-family HTH domain